MLRLENGTIDDILEAHDILSYRFGKWASCKLNDSE